ncbi:methyl-accepting chemotaxis protein [Serratia sp. Se-RSBMAAmG]|uniref:methyl-accepting chemotaxis protein n=1 Tax=Serratia sp. Se-RSBMAAmG TaxID=3043305 RepID=UPI0024AFA4EE|nr:methyl-accepting chemotaxis protein [Serratia sp. Se-RSBMAAmG]MDI6977650.1 methyl-accepting chemotaxis protein [Serratia sp. Se-RSBMAAmG]
MKAANKTTKVRPENSTKKMVLKVLAVLCIVASGGSIYKYIDDMDGNYNEKNITTNVAYLSQNMLRASSSAIDGNPNAFKSLAASQDRVGEQLSLLLKGGKTIAGITVPAPKDSISNQLNMFKDSVNEISNNITYILNEKEDIIALNDATDKYTSSLNKVLNQIRLLSANPALSGTSIQTVLAKTYQDLSSDRVVNLGSTKDMLNSDYLTNQNQIVQVIALYTKEISALPGDVARLNNAAKASKDTDTLFNYVQELNDNSVRVIDLLPSKINAMKFKSQIDTASDRLNSAYDSLNYILKSDAGDINVWLYFAIIFVAISLFAFLAVVRLSDDDAVIGTDPSRTKKYKETINSLSKTIELLFEGNAINKEYLNNMTMPYNNQTLSKILDRIRRFSSNVVFENEELTGEIGKSYTFMRESKQLADKLKEGSEDDKRKVEKIANEVESVISSANNTKRAAEDIKSEFEENIENSRTGALKIQDTISKMNMTRDTIQATSKRIKKLSESTQGIGGMTDNIREIASRIQVIAINAAIEATEAGEAGKKLLVVSSEIEKLAEGANNAAKTIDKIVEDIVGDAKQTVSKMESSSADVVESSMSAEAAGESLKEINLILERLQGRILEVYKGSEKELTQLTEVLNEITLVNERHEKQEAVNDDLVSNITKADNKISGILRKRQAK